MNFGAGLRNRGKRVLLIDMDPQCSLSYIMRGIEDGPTVQDLILDPQADAAPVIQHLEEGDLIRSSRDLVTLEIQLTDVGRAFRLSKVLKQLS